MGASPILGLLLIACDCAERVGDREAEDQAIDWMVRSDAAGVDRADALLYAARRDRARGNLHTAEQAFAGPAAGFLEAGQVREWALSRSGIADILSARGELDEALATHTVSRTCASSGAVSAQPGSASSCTDLSHPRSARRSHSGLNI